MLKLGLIYFFIIQIKSISQFVESLNKFGIETLQLTNPEDDTQNTVFSPYSAFVCVAMSTSLFTNQTRAEILKSLRINLNESQIEAILGYLHELIYKENTDKVSTSNKIWVNQILNFDPETFTPNQKILQIPIEKVTFPQPACDKINEEVNRATKGMIPKLVGPSDVGQDSAIVLVNAIYFKSEWEKKFDIDPESKNADVKNFKLINGTDIHTIMLQSFEQKLPYTENDQLQLVSIPYLHHQYDFVLIVPKENSIEGFNALKKLTYESLNNELLTNMRRRKVNVKLPKFTLESTLQLNDVFRKLGIDRAFTNLADCTDPNVKYFISSIVQKAKIILDENGTEAAAATGMMMMSLSLDEEEIVPNIFADHPFLYLLRNTQTGSILFEGFVKKPSC